MIRIKTHRFMTRVLPIVIVLMLICGCSADNSAVGKMDNAEKLLNENSFSEDFTKSAYFTAVKGDVIEYYNLVRTAYNESDKVSLSTFTVDKDILHSLSESIITQLDSCNDLEESYIVARTEYFIAWIGKTVAGMELLRKTGADNDPNDFQELGEALDVSYSEFTTGISDGSQGPASAGEDDEYGENGYAVSPSSINQEKLDAVMILVDASLKDSFGDRYKLEYDHTAVVVSIYVNGSGKAVEAMKEGNTSIKDEWDKLLSLMKEMSSTLKEMLEDSDVGEIPVFTQCLDDRDKSTPLIIAEDGEIIYDAAE